jgi:flagellar hook assembly protein FlgD
VVWATLEATAVAVPVDTRIAAVTPNPFNPQTTLSVEVGVDGRVVLDLFDGAGRRVRRLADSAHPAGVHRFAWDGRDDAGRELGSGTYYARLRAGGVTRVQRLVLVR